MTMYASQTGAGLQDGTSVANAWSMVNIDLLANQNIAAADGELYFLGTITSQFIIRTTTGFVIRGDYVGQECTFNGGGLIDDCIRANTKTFTGILTIKNLTVQNGHLNATTGDIYLFQTNNVLLDNVIFVGTASNNSGLVLNGNDNVEVKNCTISNYGANGIDIVPASANPNINLNIHHNNCSNNNNIGIKLRTAASTDIYNCTIANNTCNNNGEAGILLRANALSKIYDIIMEYNLCDNNGGTLFGTGIEMSGNSNTENVHNCILRYNVVRNTQQTARCWIKS